jgi:hypothetical protein
MTVDLDPTDVETLLTSVEYSKDRVRNGNAPHDQKQQTLSRLDSVAQKLRAARKAPLI